MTDLLGGCHCGDVTVSFASTLDPAATAPRACDCSFCRKHGAGWVSDPGGELAIATQDASLVRYRQVSNTADFLLCAHCGVLVAVVLEESGSRFGAVNAGCLDSQFAVARCASPQQLARDEKVERWRRLWAPRVVVSER